MYMPLVSKQTLVLALAALNLVAANDEPQLEEPTDGAVIGHLFPECNGQKVGGHKAITVPVDRCLTTPKFAIQIKTAAVCSNGTRAQWARFEDNKCGYGNISSTYGLVEIPDSDIGKCLSLGAIGGEEHVNSMAFWCEGVKKSSPDDEVEEPEDDNKEKKGSVSESACMAGRAPTFNHPKVDTCVNLRTSKMKIISPGVCANGTQSTLALYEEKSCAGAPASFVDIKDEDMKSCMDFTGVSSFAFYCTGEGIEGSPESPSRPGQPRQSGGIMQFLLVLTLICMMFFLMLVLSIFTWVRKYGGSVGKLIEFAKNLVKPNDGSIAI